MKGRRVYPNAEGELWLAEGEYGYDDKHGYWEGRAPSCHTSNLSKHTVVEHDDGTITVSPSIAVYTSDKQGGYLMQWHGYLEHGVWREV